MNSVVFLKELWRRRLLVALAFLASAAVAVLIVYQVGAAPPSLTERGKVEAEGSIEVLVDAANSPIANARFELGGLTARAGVFARLMSGGNVIRQVSRETGIPVRKIDVAGPVPLAGEAPGIAEGPAHERPYRIEVTQQSELPILTVQTRAPTVEGARALAAAAPRAMSREVAAIQSEQDTPEGKRVVFRVLGPAQAALVDNSAGKKIAVAAFVVLLAIFLTLIVGLPRFVAAWRAADVEPPAGAGVPEPEPAPAPAEAPKRRKRRRKAAPADGPRPDGSGREKAKGGPAAAKDDAEPTAAERPKAGGVPALAAVSEAATREPERDDGGNGHAKDAARDD